VGDVGGGGAKALDVADEEEAVRLEGGADGGEHLGRFVFGCVVGLGCGVGIRFRGLGGWGGGGCGGLLGLVGRAQTQPCSHPPAGLDRTTHLLRVRHVMQRVVYHDEVKGGGGRQPVALGRVVEVGVCGELAGSCVLLGEVQRAGEGGLRG